MCNSRKLKLYNYYSNYLKEKFGTKVYKVSIDGGFTCPNRDGTKGFNGCIFCDSSGSSSRTHAIKTSIQEQILKNIEVRKTRYKAKKFIAYFQSFTNTYGEPAHLKKIYDEALCHPDIIGLSISTRPDCINEEKLQLIADYKKKLPYVNIEYGLQTIHDKTLDILNRKETLNDFLNAYELTRKFDIEHTVHLILGLPNETIEDQMQTADFIAKNKIMGVKIHFLVAMENTPLAKMFEQKTWIPLCFDKHIQLACDFLERLHPECIIHRISGNGHPLHLIAPQWMKERKEQIIPAILTELEKRQSFQGKFCRFL